MGKARKARKFAKVKKILSTKDNRLKTNKKEPVEKEDVHHVNTIGKTGQYFFTYNKALGPPYNILLDTNFVHVCTQIKIDIIESLISCLYAPCNVMITDCVIGELEKLGSKFRLALRVIEGKFTTDSGTECGTRFEPIKKPSLGTPSPFSYKIERLPCLHKGTYADNCIMERIESFQIYCVATNDRDLKARIRKVPGIPIISVHTKKRKAIVERLPHAPSDFL